MRACVLSCLCSMEVACGEAPETGDAASATDGAGDSADGDGYANDTGFSSLIKTWDPDAWRLACEITPSVAPRAKSR